jgi:RNA polymerase subunit RPABC4/transcription elongation factor Spt4
MSQGTKYCKHCGEIIDSDCVVCPKCGKQVEMLNTGRDIIINNSASAASSASATSYTPNRYRKMPWYLSWFWIITFGFCTGGIYFIVGLIMRSNWKSHN